MDSTRSVICAQMAQWRERLQPDGRDWTVLEIGIEGDASPSGNHSLFSNGNMFYTLDIQPECKPDVAADICRMPFASGVFDLVICSQVLEHVWNVGGAVTEMARVTKPGGHLMLDTPFLYTYHGSGSNPGQEDYWRFTAPAMDRLLRPFFPERLVTGTDGRITAALAQRGNSDCPASRGEPCCSL